MQTRYSRLFRNGAALAIIAAVLLPGTGGAELVKVEVSPTFEATTAKLDGGGSFFLYLAADAFLGELSEKVGELVPFVSGMIEDAATRDAAVQAIESVQGFIRRSGVEGIAAFGMSVAPVDSDLHRVRSVMQKVEGADGHLWRYFGTAPHPMTGAEVLPADTVLASFGDIDLEGIWNAISELATEANVAPVVTALQEASEQVRQTTGRSLEEHLAAFAGEMGWVFSLDAERTFDFAMENVNLHALPEPGLALVLRMKDDALYQWLSEAMGENPEVQRGESGSAVWASMPAPMPAPFPLSPTIAQVGDYLVLASSSGLVEQMGLVHAGAADGVQGQAEWRRLTAGLPVEGNGFNFVSARFGQTIEQAQQAMLESAMQEAADSGVPMPDMSAIQSFFGISMDVASYSVSWMDQEGWQSAGHSTKDPVFDVVRSLMLVPVGVLAGVAVPAVVGAREQGKRAACMSRMRQIGVGLQVYAMERDGELPPHLAALRLSGMDDPSLFECPDAPAGMPITWEAIREGRTAYEYLGAGLNLGTAPSDTVVLRCLIHRTELRLDGSVVTP